MAQADAEHTNDDNVLQADEHELPRRHWMTAVKIGELEAKANLLRIISGNRGTHRELGPILSLIARNIDEDCEFLRTKLFEREH